MNTIRIGEGQDIVADGIYDAVPNGQSSTGKVKVSTFGDFGGASIELGARDDHEQNYRAETDPNGVAFPAYTDNFSVVWSVSNAATSAMKIAGFTSSTDITVIISDIS